MKGRTYGVEAIIINILQRASEIEPRAEVPAIKLHVSPKDFIYKRE